ncbi:MAG: hypothetical protein QOE99_1014 [Actinomycetota bacterium]|jgi:hypothetical protein|nr:hypothetical protein [Actinomycetota bacterium]
MATRRTNTLLIWLFGVLAVSSIVITGVFNHLLAGDPRVLVVTMATDAGQAGRDQLKHDCGSLPGISVVADQGNPSPEVQGRFPVRFKIGGTTPEQEAALERCINKHGSLVRGVLTEGDN